MKYQKIILPFLMAIASSLVAMHSEESLVLVPETPPVSDSEEFIPELPSHYHFAPASPQEHEVALKIAQEKTALQKQKLQPKRRAQELAKKKAAAQKKKSKKD